MGAWSLRPSLVRNLCSKASTLIGLKPSPGALSQCSAYVSDGQSRSCRDDRHWRKAAIHQRIASDQIGDGGGRSTPESNRKTSPTVCLVALPPQPSPPIARKGILTREASKSKIRVPPTRAAPIPWLARARRNAVVAGTPLFADTTRLSRDICARFQAPLCRSCILPVWSRSRLWRVAIF
jgi:hypothetical protein